MQQSEQKSGPESTLNWLSGNIKVQAPGYQRLCWHNTPTMVLVIKKDMDAEVTLHFKTMIEWLANERKLKVFVEAKVKEQLEIRNDKTFLSSVHDYNVNDSKNIDFIICLGGDGTFLHASGLFQSRMPPVLAFKLGTLGFLTKLPFDNFKSLIDEILQKKDFGITVRNRLECRIYRAKSKTIERYQVLNEILIHRGQSATVANVTISINDCEITKVVGDGLLIATPNGSTAYSLSAGGSIVHPSIPCMLFTAICPHSLSARPMILPDHLELKIQSSLNARGSIAFSLDGDNNQLLMKGDHITIAASTYPLVSINVGDPVIDWLQSVNDILHWNKR